MGQLEQSLRFVHDADGWAQARALLAKFGSPPVAVETSQGAIIELLLQSGAPVFPVHPLRAKRYRERKAPSGIKDDQQGRLESGRRPARRRPWLEAAVGRRSAGRRAAPDLPRRDRAHRAAHGPGQWLARGVREYYPTALEAFEDWTKETAWQFVLQFPTPAELVKAGQRRWQKFLHAHRLWRPQTAEERLALFAKAQNFCGSPALTKAKSLQAVALAKVLVTLRSPTASLSGSNRSTLCPASRP